MGRGSSKRNPQGGPRRGEREHNSFCRPFAFNFLEYLKESFALLVELSTWLLAVGLVTLTGSSPLLPSALLNPLRSGLRTPSRKLIYSGA
eukprot:scaffold555919_cov39-Prasinocladus_malaysianus.AAC.1